MIDVSNLDDETVCFTLAGLYLHHWANLEQSVNEALGNALDLNYMQMVAITANVNFINKLRILQSAVSLTITRDADRKRLHAILDSIHDPYRDRNLIAHSQFGPLPNNRGITFFKDGAKKAVRLTEVYWSIDDCCSRIETLISKAEEVKQVSLALEQHKRRLAKGLASIFAASPMPYGAKKLLDDHQ